MSEELLWIPLYIDKLLSSQRWRMMQDFERGWYLSLIVESVRSERPGFLRCDENLWRLAGARSEQFFKAKNVAVLACFESRQIEGDLWIYSARLVQTLEEQQSKLNKRRRRSDPLPSYSLSDFREKESTTTPELPASALARGMCEELGMPATMGNLRPITAAIEAVSKMHKIAIPAAYDALLWKAKEAQSNGELITKFWFEDSRWKGDRNAQRDAQIESVASRVAREMAAKAGEST